jgi:deazaflavin-dependent oxidoreductase (nitroreductase family)
MDATSKSSLRARLDRIAAHETTRRTTLMTKVFRAVGPTRPFVAFYRRFGPIVDPWLMRKTGGQIATKVYGFPVLLLVTVGAKTGQKRTSPLLYAREGDDFFVVGTNFGTKDHPAWTGNLLKTPSAEIVVGEDTVPVEAEVVDEDTFKRIWPRFSSVYAGYDKYLERLTHRDPRMFRLRPVERTGTPD